jgi:hypothetical protein
MHYNASPLLAIIPSLIGGDQTGFVFGQCIAESFAYATDLLHYCYKRNTPTIILKLHFHKAFDFVNWDSLLKILHCCGFSNTCCSWVSDLVSTGKYAMLLNGVPGNWTTLLLTFFFA